MTMAIEIAPRFEKSGRRNSPLRRFVRHPMAVIGATTVLALCCSALFAQVIAPHDPLQIDTARRYLAPLSSWSFPLGTDELGRDTLSRLLFGGQVSLTVGIVAMVATILTGSAVGLVSGFFGGVVDNLLMRFVDTLLCFPQVFLLLIIAAFVPPTILSISLIIGFTSWMEVARIVRAQVTSLKELDFVQASRSFGASNTHIILVELLPNVLAPITVAATLKIATAVLMESYVSFLGYGVQPPISSWGNMLTNAQGNFDTEPSLAILPGLLITLTVVSFNFLGDGLRDAFDPKLKINS